ncbi:tricalbin-1 [Nematostella vectensis]|uniref:tricalbin-1 n=1 Tax=Nematostella vectensis TaxID=45351 RepID=UPI0013900EAA|nr:tricalbin-1 [Nematostella vectensis]
MANETADEIEAKARREREDTQLRLSLFVIALLSLTWLLGAYGFSYLWCLFIIPLLFTIWYRKNCRILEDRVREAEIKVHRRKALRDEETTEWLNFILNRWWNFSETSICQLVRDSLNPVLDYSRPSFIENMELVEFSFGKKTPFLKYVKVFENIDEGDSVNEPATDSNVFEPPDKIKERQRHLLVLNMDLCLHAPDTNIIIRVRLGGKMLGADVDVGLEDVSLSGRAQIVFELDHMVPFPHMKSVAVTFLEKPEVGFDVRMMKAVQVMDIPMLKDFINALVMDSLTYALVDPGRIEIPLHAEDPNELLNKPRKSAYASGVLTISAKGGLPIKFTDDQVFASFKVGEQEEKCSEKTQGGTSWEGSFSFLIYDLTAENLIVEVRGKRVFGTKYTIAKYKLFLNALGLEKKKKVDTTLEKEGIKGSRLEITLEYAPLKTFEVSTRTNEEEFLSKYKMDEPVNIKSGVLLVALHSGSKLLSMDADGYSDPYCIITSNREKVKTTSVVEGTVNPVWDSITEILVKDINKTNLHFFVYDRDRNWQGQADDFMGSCALSLNSDNPAMIKKKLDVKYKVFGKKRSEDSFLDAGSIMVSTVFQPVEFVAKSETEGDTTPLENGEHIDDLNEHAKKHTMKSSMKTKRQIEEMMLIKERGVLVVSILQAKNLVSMDSNGLSDPFCVVRVNSSKKFKTNVIYESLNPVWNQSVSIAMPQGGDKLIVDMFDKDVFQNDFMGSVTLTADDVQAAVKKGSEWYKLKDVDSGEIQLSLKKSSKGEEVPDVGDVVDDPTQTGDNDAESPETPSDGMGALGQALQNLQEYANNEGPPVYYCVSGEVIQASEIKGWGAVMVKARFDIPRKGRKGSVKYEQISMCTTPPQAPESGLVKWNYIFQTSGGAAIPNDAVIIFELKDAKKKTQGLSKISIQEFFKGCHFKKGKTRDNNNDEKCSETKWMNLEYDGMTAGRIQVMLSYSDVPDAPIELSTMRKRSLLKRFSSNSNL